MSMGKKEQQKRNKFLKNIILIVIVIVSDSSTQWIIITRISFDFIDRKKGFENLI